jgi:CMP-N,N'-diacetyllegionaminic acid synthase
MRTIAVIPARGGSKGIPQKNIKEFCGHPLLAWSVAVARRTKQIDGVYVSTDNSEIRRVAQDYGAEVILRPAEISGDQASSESALLHALEVVGKEHGTGVERILFLQATSPLRETKELDEALKLFDTGGYDSLFSAANPEDFCIWKEGSGHLDSLNYDYRNRKRRQEADGAIKLWIETGSFYVTNAALLRRTGNRLGGKIAVYPVPLWKSHEIDSMEGFELCAWLMHHHHLDQRSPAPTSDCTS